MRLLPNLRAMLAGGEKRRLLALAEPTLSREREAGGRLTPHFRASEERGSPAAAAAVLFFQDVDESVRQPKFEIRIKR